MIKDRPSVFVIDVFLTQVCYRSCNQMFIINQPIQMVWGKLGVQMLIGMWSNISAKTIKAQKCISKESHFDLSFNANDNIRILFLHLFTFALYPKPQIQNKTFLSEFRSNCGKPQRASFDITSYVWRILDISKTTSINICIAWLKRTLRDGWTLPCNDAGGS